LQSQVAVGDTIKVPAIHPFVEILSFERLAALPLDKYRAFFRSVYLETLQFDSAAVITWHDRPGTTKGEPGRPPIKLELAIAALKAAFPDGIKGDQSRKDLANIIEGSPLNADRLTISRDTVDRALKKLG